LSTKIHAAVDALGNPTGIHLTGGQACDLEGDDALLPDVSANTILTDKGYDADVRVLEPLARAARPRSYRRNAIARTSGFMTSTCSRHDTSLRISSPNLSSSEPLQLAMTRPLVIFVAAIHFAAAIWLN
jgi:transposase